MNSYLEVVIAWAVARVHNSYLSVYLVFMLGCSRSKLAGYVGVEGAGWLDHGFQAPICHGATVYVTSVPENHAKDKICFDQRSVSNETVYEQS